MKYYLMDEYRAVFGERRLSEIGYLDLETYRNRRKATPTKAGKPRTKTTVTGKPPPCATCSIRPWSGACWKITPSIKGPG